MVVADQSTERDGSSPAEWHEGFLVAEQRAFRVTRQDWWKRFFLFCLFFWLTCESMITHTHTRTHTHTHPYTQTHTHTHQIGQTHDLYTIYLKTLFAHFVLFWSHTRLPLWRENLWELSVLNRRDLHFCVHSASVREVCLVFVRWSRMFAYKSATLSRET